jgi:hypothetical protein
MEIRDVLFETSRFNFSKAGEHFINPCCFGEDFGQWLANKLAKHGVSVSILYQEDWGWEFSAADANGRYYIGVGGNSLEDVTNPDRGEWRVMLTKRRSIMEKLKKKNKLGESEPILLLIREILQAEPDFSNLHMERDL